MARILSSATICEEGHILIPGGEIQVVQVVSSCKRRYAVLVPRLDNLCGRGKRRSKKGKSFAATARCLGIHDGGEKGGRGGQFLPRAGMRERLFVDDGKEKKVWWEWVETAVRFSSEKGRGWKDKCKFFRSVL